jgi:hypothetical protein
MSEAVPLLNARTTVRLVAGRIVRRKFVVSGAGVEVEGVAFGTTDEVERATQAVLPIRQGVFRKRGVAATDWTGRLFHGLPTRSRVLF